MASEGPAVRADWVAFEDKAVRGDWVVSEGPVVRAGWAVFEDPVVLVDSRVTSKETSEKKDFYLAFCSLLLFPSYAGEKDEN